MKRVLGIVLVITLALLTGCSRETTKTANNRHDAWAYDLEFLVKELPKRHKNLFFQLDKKAFYWRAEEIRDQIDELTDEELIVELSRLVASVGDAHTVVYPELGRIYPLRFYWFKEGIYAIAASEEYAEVVNLKLETINGKPMEKVLAELRGVISHENEASFKCLAVEYLLIPPIMQGLGIVDDACQMGFADHQGEKVVVVSPADVDKIKYILGTTERPLYRRHGDLYYWYEYLPEHRTLYFQYNVCADMEQPFREFTEEMFAVIEDNVVDKLIVDLRNNSGGNSLVMQPFIGRIQKSSLNDRDGLFVVIGRRTFSSAILNALQLKDSTEATFVGEATGGKPNHYGEVGALFLKNTGITVTYSKKYFKHSNEDVDSLLPDVIIEPSIVDYKRGQDPVVDWILSRPPRV
ncbi:MAG: peptidase S41 [Firmicutes bacterium]|nr:peptidase S41 [Bacillota bacterium]